MRYVSKTAQKKDPKLWDRIKRDVTKGDKGGEPGQWSARKAQLAVQEYKKAGGEFVGEKADDNSLQQWTEEDWGTKSARKSGDTHERYLPKAARNNLSDKDYARTTAQKRADHAKGRQFSQQPKDVAEKTKPYRKTGGAENTKASLYEAAKRKNIPNRSRMTKSELAEALQRAG